MHIWWLANGADGPGAGNTSLGLRGKVRHYCYPMKFTFYSPCMSGDEVTLLPDLESVGQLSMPGSKLRLGEGLVTLIGPKK